MPRAARAFSAWMTGIDDPFLRRRVLNTNLANDEEALGWLDYISEVRDAGITFLRSHGHAKSPQKSFLLFQAFVRQAKSFYRSAENLDYRSSPLKFYYCFLNLAKAYILVNQPQFKGTRITHGLSYKLTPGPLSKQTIIVAKTGVFPAFYRQMIGVQLTNPVRSNVSTILAYCMDIQHEYQTAGFGPSRAMLGKLSIAIDRPANDSWLVAAIANFEMIELYKKTLREFTNAMEEVELDNAKALSLFNINQAQKGSYRFFETKARFAMLGNKPPTPAMISAWKTAIGKSQVVQPYRDDFDFFLNPPLRKNLQLPFVEPLALYAMIFFLGSLVRYHPDFLESLLASRDSWIIERFVKAAPISLLLFMRNLIHGEHFAYISR